MDAGQAVARAARPGEGSACRELVERIFGPKVRLFDILTGVDPDHRPEYVRVVDYGGRLAAVAVVVPRRILLAGLPVEGAVVALVGTDSRYRGRGFGRLLVEDTLAFIRSRGFRIAMVRGAPDFYGKFGFVPCLGSYSVNFSARNVRLDPAAPTGGERLWRPMTDHDTSALCRLYQAVTARTPCAVVRSEAAWVWRSPRPSGARIFVLQVRRGEPGSEPAGDGQAVAAYVRWSLREPGPGQVDRGVLVVPEIGAKSPYALAEALRWTAAKALEGGLGQVRFAGPPDHPFARLAYLMGRAEMRVSPAAAGRVIVTNRGLLLADLIPVFQRRAQSAGLEPGSRLTIDVGTKRFELVETGGLPRLVGGRAGLSGSGPVSRLSPEAFTYLVTGYASGAEVAALPGAAVAPEHREALEALFPSAFPQWVPAPYWADFEGEG